MPVWKFLDEDLFPWPLASVLINTWGLWVEAGATHPESSVCVLSASSETLKRRDYYMSVLFWIDQSTVNIVWHMFGCCIPRWEQRARCFMSLLLLQQCLALCGIFQCFSWCDKGQVGVVLLSLFTFNPWSTTFISCFLASCLFLIRSSSTCFPASACWCVHAGSQYESWLLANLKNMKNLVAHQRDWSITS